MTRQNGQPQPVADDSAVFTTDLADCAGSDQHCPLRRMERKPIMDMSTGLSTKRNP